MRRRRAFPDDAAMAVRPVYDTRPRPRRLWLAWLTLLTVAVAVIAATAPGKGVAAVDATSGPTFAPTPTPTTAVATALDPGLVDAFDRAVAAASDAGHALTITDGFRTATEQQALFDAEVRGAGVGGGGRPMGVPARSVDARTRVGDRRG